MITPDSTVQTAADPLLSRGATTRNPYEHNRLQIDAWHTMRHDVHGNLTRARAMGALKTETDRLLPIVIAIGSLIIAVALWQAFAYLVPDAVPSPLSVVRAATAGIADLSIPTQVGLTLGRVLTGFFIGSIAGTTVGFLAGTSRLADAATQPIIELLRPIPSPAFIPLAIALLGLGNEPKIAAAALACFFPAYIGARSAIKNVDQTVCMVAEMFLSTKKRRLLNVLIPAALPGTMVGLRTGLAIALLVTIVFEMLIGPNGLGNLIVTAERLYKLPELYAAVAAVGILGFSLNAAFVLTERHIIPWHYKAIEVIR